jgi:hypothetical protein
VRASLQGSGLTDAEIEEYVNGVKYGPSLALTLGQFAQLGDGRRVFAHRHARATLDGVDENVSQERLLAKADQLGVAERAAADQWSNLVQALRAAGEEVDWQMVARAPFRIELAPEDPGPGPDRRASAD